MKRSCNTKKLQYLKTNANNEEPLTMILPKATTDLCRTCVLYQRAGGDKQVEKNNKIKRTAPNKAK